MDPIQITAIIDKIHTESRIDKNEIKYRNRLEDVNTQNIALNDQINKSKTVPILLLISC